MGIVIKNASFSLLDNYDFISSMKNVISAINNCLEEANTKKEDVSLLLNIGLYNDKNLYEPSYASLIQMRSEINLNPDLTDINSKKTFSFDMTNGSCGFLCAVSVLDALLCEEGKALIVSSNNHPSTKKEIDFPFSRIGTAVLLEKHNDLKGFSNYFYESEDNMAGMKSYMDIYNNGIEGRDLITFDIPENYYNELAGFTTHKIKEYIEQYQIDISKIKMFISQPTDNFVNSIIDGTGIQESSVLKIYKEYGNAHSSIVSLLFAKAKKCDFLKQGDTVLVVTAGSGFTVMISTYEV